MKKQEEILSGFKMGFLDRMSKIDWEYSQFMTYKSFNYHKVSEHKWELTLFFKTSSYDIGFTLTRDVFWKQNIIDIDYSHAYDYFKVIKYDEVVRLNPNKIDSQVEEIYRREKLGLEIFTKFGG